MVVGGKIEEAPGAFRATSRSAEMRLKIAATVEGGKGGRVADPTSPR